MTIAVKQKHEKRWNIAIHINEPKIYGFDSNIIFFGQIYRTPLRLKSAVHLSGIGTVTIQISGLDTGFDNNTN